MLGASPATRCGAVQSTCNLQAARPHVVRSPSVKRSRGGLMKKVKLYGAAAQAALLGNVSLGTRTFSTVQAMQAQTTAQLLQQWQQEAHIRQQPNAVSQQPANQVLHARKINNRRRSNQRLNIVPGINKSLSSNQQKSLDVCNQPKQQTVSLDKASNSAARHDPQALKSTPSRAAKQRAAPEGTNFRSLATSSLLLSHAQLLQQLQQGTQTDQAAMVSSKASQATHATRQTPSSQQGMASPQYAQEAQMAQHAAAQRLDPARQAGDAEQDTMSLALDLVDNQLPHWSHKQPLDWSAQQDLSCYQPELRVNSSNSKHSNHILTKFTMHSQGEQVEVQPMWIAIHQEQPGGPARMYETVHCLQPEVLEHVPQTVQPFCLVEGMTFGKPQFSHGPWKGYLVGVVGDVAAEEDNVLWPNRMFCGKRVMHNIRNGWDIAKFLAEPTVQDMDGHAANLRLLQTDRNYQPGWVWHMLRSRWGDEAVAAYSSAKAAEQTAAVQQANSQLSSQQRAVQQAASQQQAQQRIAAQQQAALRLARQQVAPRRAMQFA